LKSALNFTIVPQSTVISGTLSKEIENIGRYQTTFNTEQLDSDSAYVIKISASKSGYNPPSDIELQLYVAENELLLNQSENDDSTQTPYWSEDADMSVLPYGVNSENLIVQESIFQFADNSFNFTVPDVESEWNLTRIVFDVYNITWNVGTLNELRMHITDPYGVKYTWSDGDSDPNDDLDANLVGGTGNWTNLIIELTKPSPNLDNNFDFVLNGTYDGSVNVIAKAYFERDHVNVLYSKFNQTDDISITSDGRGWAIQNVTFNIYNCYDTSTWDLINPETDNMRIVTNESTIFSVTGTGLGTGILTIENITVYPLEGQFLFSVLSDSAISFVLNRCFYKILEYIQQIYLHQKK
jgi:hypothetical protein